MFTYSAICDVPVGTLDYLTSLLLRHRRAHDTQPHQRAGTARTQAKLLLRWFRDGSRVANLGRDQGISQATAYRYLIECIEVLADQAPDLHGVVAQAKTDGLPYVSLDGTLAPHRSAGATDGEGQARLVLGQAQGVDSAGRRNTS
ncbi:hypothetical protein IEE92_13485 [Kocuria sp. cx-116]|uniref:hypothetical protein n=1 Tax=Kocuria sp. cx-116 TaxID=2771378 RepID=UPI001685D701|nr:hypothetical protein [Kocuria sp. cx-116]MBD2763541.1 hypothetical protein [Kocuria sp. cx-116]